MVHAGHRDNGNDIWLSLSTVTSAVLALKSGYYLDGSKATPIPAADYIMILACVKARSGR
jgi:hypothetical protein